MVLPTGQVIKPQQILAGMALLGVQSESEIKTSTYLLGLAKATAVSINSMVPIERVLSLIGKINMM